SDHRERSRPSGATTILSKAMCGTACPDRDSPENHQCKALLLYAGSTLVRCKSDPRDSCCIPPSLQTACRLGLQRLGQSCRPAVSARESQADKSEAPEASL